MRSNSNQTKKAKKDTLKTFRDLVGHVQNPVGPDDKANKVCRDHCKNVDDASTGTDVPVPSVPSELIARTMSGDDSSIGEWRQTLDWGTSLAASSSGRMNKLTSHPHASKRKDRSCHKATNVNMSAVVTATFLVPPSGM